MASQKNRNVTLFLLVVFIILTILLGGYIVYDKVLNKNKISENSSTNVDYPTKQDTTSTIYTYDELSGHYTTEVNEKAEEVIEGDPGVTTYSLYLYENGTFSFRWAHIAPVGFIGNYIIKDNQIVLNPLYDTNSGASKTKTTNKPTILTISQDGTLETDGETIKKITLSKSNDNTTENEFDHFFNYEGC